MLLSMLLAWAAAALTAVAASKYLIRKSGNRRLNARFSRSHIGVGTALILTGLLHGLLAGNLWTGSLADVALAPELFTLNWGTACFLAAVLLGLTYAFRRSLKRLWMPLHRALTVLLICLVVVHVANVGIHVDDRLAALFPSAETEEAEETEETGDDEDDDEAAVQTAQPTQQLDSTETAAVATAAQAQFSGAVLNDGTYEGSADGYRGTITVSVTVSGGQVTDITILSESDSQQYFSRASSLTDTIVSQQSLEVDAVSGATYSSAGIINAVADALQSAVASGTLQVASIQASQGSRGGH